MEKRLYGKPLMSVEQFTPSEYVAECWYVESGNCYSYLIEDKAGIWGLGSPDNWFNPQGSDVVLARNHGTNHALPDPDDNPPYFRGIKPENINNGHFYDYPNGYNYDTRTKYHENIKTDIYKVTYNGTDHYVKKVNDAGNHS